VDFAVDGGRGRLQLSESCACYRRHLRPPVSSHLRSIQHRLLADLLATNYTQQLLLIATVTDRVAASMADVKTFRLKYF